MIYKNEDGRIIDFSNAYDIYELNRIFGSMTHRIDSCQIYKFFYVAQNKEFRKKYPNSKRVKIVKTDIVPHFNDEKLYKVYFETKYKGTNTIGRHEFTAPYDFRFFDFSDFSTMFILQFCDFKRPHFCPHMVCTNPQEMEKAGLITTHTIYYNNEPVQREERIIL